MSSSRRNHLSTGCTELRESLTAELDDAWRLCGLKDTDHLGDVMMV
jgi:hypothetical protein